MEFRKYEKIHRLGKDETLGILEGTVHVEEKANVPWDIQTSYI